MISGRKGTYFNSSVEKSCYLFLFVYKLSPAYPNNLYGHQSKQINMEYAVDLRKFAGKISASCRTMK